MCTRCVPKKVYSCTCVYTNMNTCVIMCIRVCACNVSTAISQSHDHIFWFTKSKTKPHLLGSCNNHSNKRLTMLEGYEQTIFWAATWGWCFQEAGFYAWDLYRMHDPFEKNPRLFWEVCGPNEYSDTQWPQQKQGWQITASISPSKVYGLRSCIGQQIHGQSMSLKNRACHTHTQNSWKLSNMFFVVYLVHNRFRETDMTFPTYHLENSPNTSMFHPFFRDFPQKKLELFKVNGLWLSSGHWHCCQLGLICGQCGENPITLLLVDAWRNFPPFGSFLYRVTTT